MTTSGPAPSGDGKKTSLFIDIHVHTRRTPGLPRWGEQTYATPQQLIERYDGLGIECGVILPGTGPECAYQVQSNEAVLEICEQHPGRFVPFCNIHPRMLANAPDAPLGDLMRFYRDKGCRGIGEVSANLPFLDPLVQNLFRHAEDAGLPLTFHMAPQIGDIYGLYDEPGLPQLERSLQRFPKLVFLAHSQAFWAEIGRLATPADRYGYPAGPVDEDGVVPTLMRRYPNLHGDLSANSGYNAVSRDEAFGARFLEEFQDRLYFGTDICTPTTPAPLAGYLTRLRDEGRISAECFHKVARGNAEALVGQ